MAVERSGDVLTIRPKRMTMAELMRRLDELPAPYSVEVRDPDIFPDREGLSSVAWLLDTGVAIPVRDAAPRYRARIDALGDDFAISIITRVELEDGVHSEPEQAGRHPGRLALFLSNVAVLPFDDQSADTYRDILAATGFSRRKTRDRMISAQARMCPASSFRPGK